VPAPTTLAAETAAPAEEAPVEEAPAEEAAAEEAPLKVSDLDLMLKNSRRYNIDLSPALLLANGFMVETLVQSGVHQYCEFKAAQASFLYQKKKIRKVPCSKNDIFSDKVLSCS